MPMMSIMPSRQRGHSQPGGRFGAQLAGRRVLVVEDEMLLALDLEEGLNDAGCDVVGPAGNLRTALALARSETIDAAILDVNLGGESVFPVAQALAARRVPFLFATAYAGADELYPGDVRQAPRLAKPYTISQAIGHLNALLNG